MQVPLPLLSSKDQWEWESMMLPCRKHKSKHQWLCKNPPVTLTFRCQASPQIHYHSLECLKRKLVAQQHTSWFCCCPTVCQVPFAPSAPTASSKESGSPPVSHAGSYCCNSCTFSRATNTVKCHKYGGQQQISLFQRISQERSGRWDGTNLSLQAGVGTRRFNLQKEQTETAITLE